MTGSRTTRAQFRPPMGASMHARELSRDFSTVVLQPFLLLAPWEGSVGMQPSVGGGGRLPHVPTD